MRKLRFLSYAVFVLTFCVSLAHAEETSASLGTRFNLTHDKLERAYHLFTPPGDEKKPRPLVIVLHDSGGSPQNIADVTGFSALAEKQGFLVAYPLGSGHVPTWNAGRCCGYASRQNVDDVGFIEKMVADIRTKRNIDNTRIYATGFSNGGMMAYRLACELSNRFAAVAPVAGAMNVFKCEPPSRLSLTVFHALDDKQLPYKGGLPEKGVRSIVGRTLDPDASVGDAMKFWLKHNYCRNFPGIEDMGDVSRITYFCAEDRHVVLNTLKTGGHSWPGGKKIRESGDEPNKKINATEEIWRFFRNHPPREMF